MADRGYFLRRLKTASFDKMKWAIDAAHERSGKSKIAIFLDMANCFIRYGAGYYDYIIFAFHNLTHAQRKTFITRNISKKLNMFMNDEAYTHLFDQKDEFNKLFARWIRRGWLVIPESSKEEIEAFCKGKEEIFVKILDGECSHGVDRIKMADWPDFDALYQHMLKEGYGLLEDVVDQHPDVEALHPGSVNCLRVITMLDDAGEPHCMYVVQKMGMGDTFVDCNCMFTPVDTETGVIKYPAHSGDTPLGVVYEKQPDTGITLPGYQLPFVPEAVSMCLEAAKVVPQCRYVGWDVAISKTGPEFIEGNTFCAHDFWQLPPHTPDGIGYLPKVMALAKDFNP